MLSKATEIFTGFPKILQKKVGRKTDWSESSHEVSYSEAAHQSSTPSNEIYLDHNLSIFNVGLSITQTRIVKKYRLLTGIYR